MGTSDLPDIYARRPRARSYGAPFVSKLLRKLWIRKTKIDSIYIFYTKIDLIFMSRHKISTRFLLHKNQPDFYNYTKIDPIFITQKST